MSAPERDHDTEQFGTDVARGMRHPRLVLCPRGEHPQFLVDSADAMPCPWCPPAGTARDHAATERSRVADLAIDVAHAVTALRNADGDAACAAANAALWRALDRLTAVLLPDGPRKAPR